MLPVFVATDASPSQLQSLKAAIAELNSKGTIGCKTASTSDSDSVSKACMVKLQVLTYSTALRVPVQVRVRECGAAEQRKKEKKKEEEEEEEEEEEVQLQHPSLSPPLEEQLLCSYATAALLNRRSTFRRVQFFSFGKDRSNECYFYALLLQRTNPAVAHATEDRYERPLAVRNATYIALF